ncbi:hypothetical protein F5B22DRAFT_610266 [Xylaria bambusicola]|uniref:uncharacterized protein n=1 Tax=Xylaria bambusicola TaxID=326684 RepID=UPI0020085E67|nr:uncharacterized protein F5B22DRAFT_610266 [Xylaria bambusicola]KAI0514658.1 hypothetical protein F5B22DRAFT_610266 [Xylaria bambusicola]
MKAQIASIVAALAACTAAVPATSGAVAQPETRSAAAVGTFDGSHLWFDYNIANPLTPYQYTIGWISFGVSGYSNNSPSFYVSCTALYDDRQDVADAAWYKCIGFPFDGSVEAQFHFNETVKTVNVRQTYTEAGKPGVKVGTAVIKGALPQTFSLPYTLV